MYVQSIQASTSVMLTFSSLCLFIGNVDPGSLLDLPISVDKVQVLKYSHSTLQCSINRQDITTVVYIHLVAVSRFFYPNSCLHTLNSCIL